MKPYLELLDWLESLKASEKYIVVEGSKDKSALMKLGIDEERIVTLRRPAYAIAELLATKTKDVIILTDLDPEGKKHYMRLKTNLTRVGIRVDNKFREALFRQSKLSHIEGIDTYFKHHCFL
jgi:5S rRNA maturation endonuclease (ribonuclease M5)